MVVLNTRLRYQSEYWYFCVHFAWQGSGAPIAVSGGQRDAFCSFTSLVYTLFKVPSKNVMPLDYFTFIVDVTYDICHKKKFVNHYQLLLPYIFYVQAPEVDFSIVVRK